MTELLFNIIPLKLAVIIIFCLSYLFLFFFYKKKAYIIWAGIILILLLGVFTPKEAFGFISWNVMGIFVGTLIVSYFFIYSRMPAFLATHVINKSRSVGFAMLAICAITGFISIFVENVATVLIIAPIALSISSKLKVNPVAFIIGIAISSNLQGVATLVGDPPSMLLASFAKMTFNNFIWFMGRPGIFFAVQIGAIVSLVFLYFIFKKQKAEMHKIAPEEVTSYFPTILLCLMIIALAFASEFDPEFKWVAGTVCMAAAVVGWLWFAFREKRYGLVAPAKSLDYETIFFLLGIFVLVGALTESGVIDDISRLIAGFTGGNIFLTFNVIIWLSVLLSGFIDNVPYVLTMLPVAYSLAEGSGISPYLYLFALLIGASVGGNITPVGAAANIVAIGILKKEGHHVRFWDFVKIGLPFTILSVAASCIFVWFVWG